MRLDLFLKASRVCPTRTVAQKLCDAGLVFLNGTPAKSAHAVKTGDKISIRRKNQITNIRVLRVPDTRQISREDADGLFELLSQVDIDPAA